MNIPESLLPCIVVTADLQSKDLVWLHTAPETIREQLRHLGYLASRHKGGTLWNEVCSLQADAELRDRSGTSSLDSTVAEAIADVISLALRPVGRIDTESAKQRSRRTLSKLFKSLNHQKKISRTGDDEPDSGWLEQVESKAL
jgi:hypothetical protein